MKEYIIYHMPHKQPMEQIDIFKVEEDNISTTELENRIDTFIKKYYKDLFYECVELVFVNIETEDAEYRFNYVKDLDEIDEENAELHPYLDWLETDFLYSFVETYEDTYDEEFKGNSNRINRD